MNTKHTPGPWTTTDEGWNQPMRIVGAPEADSGRPIVCEMEMRQPFRENARLIAAAPELLAALEQCWQATGEAIQGDCTPEKLKAANKAARAVITKATA